MGPLAARPPLYAMAGPAASSRQIAARRPVIETHLISHSLDVLILFRMLNAWLIPISRIMRIASVPAGLVGPNFFIESLAELDC